MNNIKQFLIGLGGALTGLLFVNYPLASFTGLFISIVVGGWGFLGYCGSIINFDKKVKELERDLEKTKKSKGQIGIKWREEELKRVKQLGPKLDEFVIFAGLFHFFCELDDGGSIKTVLEYLFPKYEFKFNKLIEINEKPN